MSGRAKRRVSRRAKSRVSGRLRKMIEESNEKKRNFYLYAVDHIPLRYQITDPNSHAVSANDNEVYFVHPDEGLQAILRDVNREPQFLDKEGKSLFEKEKQNYYVKITQ